MDAEAEPVERTPGQLNFMFDSSNDLCSGQDCVAHVFGAGTRPTSAEAIGNSRLLLSAWNSYDRHCVDAVQCAEDDLLGELIGLLREARKYALGSDCSTRNLIERIDAVLAKTHEAKKYFTQQELLDIEIAKNEAYFDSTATVINDDVLKARAVLAKVKTQGGGS